MSEKEKLLENLAAKSGKSLDELNKLIAEKVDELSGLVSEEGAVYIIANDLGVRLDADRPKKDADLVKIEEITEPKTPVSFICKVIRKYDRVTFSSDNNEGSVQSILVGDETGITRVVFWHEKTQLLENIQDGDVLKITNAYTRENARSERIEVHYGQYSDIEVNPKGVDIQLKEFERTNFEFTQKKVSELEEGDRNIQIKGIITDFEIPRFYIACPECFKKVFQDEGSYKCAEHEEVEAIKVPIINIIIDDSSATIPVVGFRDRAEKIAGIPADEIIGLTEDVDKYKAFSKKMVGSTIELGGNVSLSNMTGEKQFLANQILSIELKSVDEVADELVKESKKEEPKKKETNPVEDDIDEIDMDIEEIDIDDDLL